LPRRREPQACRYCPNGSRFTWLFEIVKKIFLPLMFARWRDKFAGLFAFAQLFHEN